MDPLGLEKGMLDLEKDLGTFHDVDIEILDDIEEKTEAILEGWEFGDWEKEKVDESLAQSTKSTVDSTYFQGGNVGFAQTEVHSLSTTDQDQRLVDHALAFPDFIGYVRSFSPSEGLSDPIPVYSRWPIFLKDVLRTFPDVLFPRSQTFTLKEGVPSLVCVPSCILEPMKVRVITKPATGMHVRMHKLQKSLWRYLKNHWTGFFKLIGTPFELNHLDPLLEGWFAGEFFCSGDFSAATNKLFGLVSDAIVKIITSRFLFRDPILCENVRQSLTGLTVLSSRMKFPKYEPELNIFNAFEPDLNDFEQRNGQLMGHVISFPVLCIANCIAYWRSREAVLGHELALNQLRRRFPVLVNGDDILFRCDRHTYQVWQQEVRKFGLIPSVGKNYFSQDYCLINSRLVRLRTRFTYLEGIRAEPE
jgi:hypothetical protein